MRRVRTEICLTNRYCVAKFTAMLRRWFSASLLLVATTLLAPAQTILVNGGFESQPNFGAGLSNDAGYSALTGSQIPGWTIEPGHAVTVHNPSLSYPVITGGYSVNLDGEGHNAHNGNLYQDFASTAGATYTLAFDWQGWYTTPTLELKVTVIDFDPLTGSTLFTGIYLHDLAGVHHVTTTFTGTGNSLRLRVEENVESGVNDNGFIVDNFDVTLTAIPEPATYPALCALSALAVAGWRWRRRVAP